MPAKGALPWLDRDTIDDDLMLGTNQRGEPDDADHS
jgi:hypothetical protein